MSSHVVAHERTCIATAIPHTHIGVLARRFKRRGRARVVTLIVYPLATSNVRVAGDFIGSRAVPLGALVDLVVPLAGTVRIASGDRCIAQPAWHVADTVGGDARSDTAADGAECAALGTRSGSPQAARIR